MFDRFKVKKFTYHNHEQMLFVYLHFIDLLCITFQNGFKNGN